MRQAEQTYAALQAGEPASTETFEVGRRLPFAARRQERWRVWVLSGKLAALHHTRLEPREVGDDWGTCRALNHARAAAADSTSDEAAVQQAVDGVRQLLSTEATAHADAGRWARVQQLSDTALCLCGRGCPASQGARAASLALLAQVEQAEEGAPRVLVLSGLYRVLRYEVATADQVVSTARTLSDEELQRAFADIALGYFPQEPELQRLAGR